MIPLLVILSLVLIVPAGAYALHGGGRNRVWGLVAAGEDVRGGSVYRGVRSTLWKRGSAPFAVRAAALTSFFLGQMIIPGGLAAIAGAIATLMAVSEGKAPPLLIVLQLSSPSGILVAAYLLVAGSAMLKRAGDAAVKARRAAQWALGHNLALLAGLGVAAALTRNEPELAVGPAIYAVISIGQALLVLHAARALEGYDVRADPRRRASASSAERCAS